MSQSSARGVTADFSDAEPLRFREAVRRVASLAAPLSVALLVAAVAQFAVVGLLGHLGADAVHVRSLYVPISFCILAVQEGLSISSQVVFARLRGAERSERAPAAFRRLVTTGLAATVVLALVVATAAPLVGSALGAEGARAAAFTSFAQLMGIATVFTVPGTVAVGALRGWGRPGLSIVMALVLAVTQVLGVWIVGDLAGLGITAVPIFVATAGLAALAVAPSLAKVARLPLTKRWLSVDATLQRGEQRTPASEWDDEAAAIASLATRTLLAVGVPVALSYMLLTAANLATMWVLAPFDGYAQTAFGIGSTVQGVIIVPAIAVGSAAGVLMHQHSAAGADRALPSLFRAAVAIVVGSYAVLSALMVLTPNLLAGLLVADSRIQAALAEFLAIVGPSYFGLGIVLFLLTVLEQLRFGALAVTLNLAYYAASIGLGALMAHSTGDASTLFRVLAISNLTGLGLLLPLTSILVRRRSRRRGFAGDPRRAEP
ncbi:MATE family efflux transporter [Pseudoclavibacter sp. AY1F1]|uniref:MATE family efflux transporter n=1 Tax=Pseudoclavibacter sp. AY1F1 TaxID=2080583 RepID=UPI0011B0E21A|nr:MATE family efflux transporter [Pseudoclavibacter sp. AY1F1]